MTQKRVSPGESVSLGGNQPQSQGQGQHQEAPARQQAQQLGVNYDHVAEMAQAVGGRDWSKLLPFIMGILQLLKTSGVLSGGGNGGTPTQPQAETEEEQPQE